MSHRYVEIVWRLHPLMDELETWLTTLQDATVITVSYIRQALPKTHITYEQAALAFAAWTDLGIVHQQSHYVLNMARLIETAGFRLGVRTGIEYTAVHIPQNTLHLLVALPQGLPSLQQETLQKLGDDLRASLIDMIASANSSLFLAAPFWDEDTINDICPVLERRLQNGIHVDLLGRFSEIKSKQAIQRIKDLLMYPQCRAFNWNHFLAEDRFGTQTFHFKCLISDSGQQAYLGSANFTTASLRSRMELGVLLTGKEAGLLWEIMKEVLSVANRWFG